MWKEKRGAILIKREKDGRLEKTRCPLLNCTGNKRTRELEDILEFIYSTQQAMD